MIAVLRQSLNGCDLPAPGDRHRHDAGAHWITVEVHRAGATQRLATGVLGAGQPGKIPDCPEQGHLRVDIEADGLPIEFEIDCQGYAPLFRPIFPHNKPLGMDYKE